VTNGALPGEIMNFQIRPVALKSSEGLPLRVELHADPEREPSMAIIVCHGFKGFKNWGFFPYLAQRLAERGFAVVRFDFSMNGIGERPEHFDRLDLFARNTYTQETDDLQRVLRWLLTEFPAVGREDGRAVGLLAHSRGSVPALAVAVEQRKAVGAVVTWNGVAHALRYSDQMLRRWEEEGAMEFTNARTGQRMSINFDFVVDAREHHQRFEPMLNAKRLEAPHLIVHGDRDLAVDPSEAEELCAGRPSPRCRLEWIEGGSHTFGAVHPFEGTTPQLELAIRLSADWFAEHLSTKD
jgi:pimeloyl-ACP methyl ester carboxylesterase